MNFSEYIFENILHKNNQNTFVFLNNFLIIRNLKLTWKKSDMNGKIR